MSSARTTEYTLEKKYSCVERKVKFESIAPAGTKLAPITEEQVKIVKSELNGCNYVSVYVDEKESGVWMNINGEGKYDERIGGIEGFIYDAYKGCTIWVGKWWPGDSEWNDYEGSESKRFYDGSDTAISFDLAATKSYLSFDVYPYNDSFEVNWKGEKDSTYEVSFEAFDNKGNAVALKKSTIAAADIKNDAFNNYEVTGKLSDLGIDIEKPITVKTIKANVKETAKDGTVRESEDEDDVDASYTSYTVVDSLGVGYSGYYDDDGKYIQQANVTLFGTNLPDTAKLYYKRYGETLYTEFKDGLKKAEDSDSLTATVSLDEYDYRNYNFRAVVTVDNKNWYDWEEGKTEETAEYPRYWD